MKKFKITQYNIQTEKIKPDTREIRVAFLSDLHNVTLGKKNQHLVEAIEHLDPNLVLIGGDMLVGRPNIPFNGVIELVRMLSKKYPVYYALGNHEYRMKIYPEVYGTMFAIFRKAIIGAGAILLDNEHSMIQVGDTKICIYGLSIAAGFYSKGPVKPMKTRDIEENIGRPMEGCINILLAHNPRYVKVYAKWGAELVFCGHYHGGMIRVGKRGLVSPYFRIFPKFSYGGFNISQSTIIVSGGLGEHTIPIRFFNPRELVVVGIKPHNFKLTKRSRINGNTS